MIELRGEIVQLKHTEDPRCALYFHNEHETVLGRYGFSCWWFPIGRKIGIKIHHSRPTHSLQAARVRLAFLERRWEQFENRTIKARKYLPEVFDWFVVMYTGNGQRGGRAMKKRNDVNVFYPATLIRSYPVAELGSIDGSTRKRIVDAFKEDGIEIHEGSFVAQNMGVSEHDYVVLDVTDSEKEKYL